jgi:hypothetical protein
VSALDFVGQFGVASGPVSTRISVSSSSQAGADVVLGSFAEGVLAGADAAQPAQRPAALWCVGSAAVDDLEANVVTGVERYAEQFGDFGKFGRDDELVGAVCRG